MSQTCALTQPPTYSTHSYTHAHVNTKNTPQTCPVSLFDCEELEEQNPDEAFCSSGWSPLQKLMKTPTEPSHCEEFFLRCITRHIFLHIWTRSFAVQTFLEQTWLPLAFGKGSHICICDWLRGPVYPGGVTRNHFLYGAGAPGRIGVDVGRRDDITRQRRCCKRMIRCHFVCVIVEWSRGIEVPPIHALGQSRISISCQSWRLSLHHQITY